MVMATGISARRASTLWIMLLTIASTLGTLALACATPFTALAALAATQMRLRDGVLLMLASWVASQAVGFCVLGYPHTTSTFLWGIALGMAAVVGVIAARFAAKRFGRNRPLFGIATAFLAATLAFQGVILLWAFGLGGVATTLSPAINATQLARNGAILIVLMLLYRGLVALGMPAAGKRRLAT
ncbi:hypothetical protein KY084_04875 [Stakelama sp. CBK3Z-3]|uniref:Uncharacterized protein n=1 Tax=Stakelama flava TaxID=2860338 RepID=A0ABS6XJ51_9SPHN|nr:hypothetical protein [Stakelama flava]MBW4330207.1 hypothetical protein [Stakelama flava]